jgi:Protein of unknown function (DUF1553)/Protein of unknown function (DUF1549)
METRWARFSRRAGGSMQGLGSPCLLMFAVVLAFGGPARAGDDSARSSRKDSHSTPAFVDRLIEEGWKKAGVKPAESASDAEFLRRVYVDMLGRIPNVQEAKAFLTTRESDRRGKLIEYLLEHPDFAKNLATVWTILLIGRGNQGQMVDRGALSTWLRKQFAGDRPWNEMVRELVSATGSNKENGAVNFVLAHLEFDAVPLTSRTTRLFLGQQIQCTQCHDHPQNDWKQGDFWGINAFFKGMRAENVTRPSATGQEAYDHTDLSDMPTDSYSRFDRRDGMVGIAFPKFLDGRKISQGQDVIRRTELGKLISDPNNEVMARAFVNRTWAHFLGRGFVEPVDDIGPHNTVSHPELLDQLAKEFKESGYSVKKLYRWIANSRAYQLSSVKGSSSAKKARGKARAADNDEGMFAQMQLKPMTPEQLFDSLLTATRAHRAGSTAGDDNNKKRDDWLRQFLFTFANDEADESTNFQGTIPQALMMMNGAMMQEALSGKPGSFLGDVCEQAAHSRSPEGYMVDSIYLAALSRHPSENEAAQVRRYLGSFPDSIQVLQDLFWALLNSNEFVLVH